MRNRFPHLALSAILCITPLTVLAEAPIGHADLEEETSSEMAQQIQRHLHSPANVDQWETIGWAAVRTFYRERGFEPAWHRAGNVTIESIQLLERLENSRKEGLEPERYLVSTINRYFSSSNPARSAWADILLTRAYVQYALDKRNGRFEPKSLDPDWNISQEPYSASDALHAFNHCSSFSDLLDSLSPSTKDYRRLVEALHRYRQIQQAGGWPALPKGPLLQPGDTDPSIAMLRQRLLITGDLPDAPFSEDPEYYGPALAEAVIRFQHRHGLRTDAKVGPATRRALNSPVEMRISQLEVNLERWRWMPYEMGEKYLLVNAAGFELKVVEGDKTRLQERIIAGKEARQTPSFNSRITSLVVNPNWTVPKRIAVEDLLPRQQEDADFFNQKRIQVYERREGRLVEVDPHTIDWSLYDEHHFPFVLRQSPGRHNSLGRLKFHLPNSYSIFLHDTPSKGLFNKPNRAFSSGCVRVEYPEQLADLLLQEDASWTPSQLRNAIDSKLTQVHRLSQTMPIYITYFTAWVDDQDRVHFRPDIYKRNAPILQALHQETRRPAYIAHLLAPDAETPSFSD